MLVGIQRDDCRWSNVCKSYVPDNDFTYLIDLEKRPDYETFLAWVNGETLLPPKGINPEVLPSIIELFKEVSMFQGNVIVPLGNIALWVLTGMQGITKRRGSILSARGHKIIPCVHPSAIMRSFSLIEQRLAMLDLERVREESRTPRIDLPHRTYRTYPTFEEAMMYIADARALKIIGFDIEVMKTADEGKEMSCIGFAHSAHDAMCIPLISHNKNYWTESQEVTVLEACAELLNDDNVIKVGQNISFDASFVYRQYGMVVKPLEDTMLAHAIRFPDLKWKQIRKQGEASNAKGIVGLDFLTRYYTREPYYKDEGKEWGSTGGDREAEFFVYNAKDSCIVLEIFEKIMSALNLQDQQ